MEHVVERYCYSLCFYSTRYYPIWYQYQSWKNGMYDFRFNTIWRVVLLYENFWSCSYGSHPAKIDLSKKWLSKQKTIQNFNIDALGFKKQEMKILPRRKWKLPANPCQPTCQQGQIGWHWLASTFYFLHGRIFISFFLNPWASILKFWMVFCFGNHFF